MAQINAWAEGPVKGPFEPPPQWAIQRIVGSGRRLRPGAGPDLGDWKDPRVGWGILLPDDPALSAAERGRVDDQPEPIQRLVEARRGPIFRYDAAVPTESLTRHYPDGRSEEVLLFGRVRGTAEGALPRYLLIHAPPSVIPWEVQYRVGRAAFVGRLSLAGDALSRYVDHLLADWSATDSDPLASVVWAVDHGGTDITSLMRRAVATPVSDRIRSDAELAPRHRMLDGSQAVASAGELLGALSTLRPGLVVTTSHGATHPIDDPVRMVATVGNLVDDRHRRIDTEAVLDSWAPDGAIWYAHACCSAGTDARTRYPSLPDSRITRVLEGVAAVGASVAPFAEGLLSAERPLRAFVGHVEPTFDISLAHRRTGDVVSSRIVEALFPGVYRETPIGRLLDPVRREATLLSTLHAEARTEYNAGQEGSEAFLRACRLRAHDAESLVVLGDPTVALRLPS